MPKVATLVALLVGTSIFIQPNQAMSQTAKPDTLKKDTINIWVPSMITSLNVSQIAFSNWTQGGSNSLSWNVLAKAGYDFKGETWSLQNHGTLQYGRTKLGSQGSITTDNEILLENVLVYHIGWVTDPFFSNTIITTLAQGYNYGSNPPVSIANFFDPGYVTQSLGFSYNKVANFTTRLGIAAQEVFTNKYRQYTNNPGTIGNLKAFKVDAGLESVTQAKVEIADNILLTTGLRLFTRFNSLSVWDVRWDNVIVAKVNSFINVNFNYQLVYQKDQSFTTQMKEGLQIGATYTIF